MLKRLETLAQIGQRFAGTHQQGPVCRQLSGQTLEQLFPRGRGKIDRDVATENHIEHAQAAERLQQIEALEPYQRRSRSLTRQPFASSVKYFFRNSGRMPRRISCTA